MHVKFFIGVFDFYQRKHKNSVFTLENNAFLPTAYSCCWVLGPKMDPKVGLQIVKNGVKKLTNFWTCFSDFEALFWVHFGSHFGGKEAMMRHDGPKKDLKSLKVPKSSNCKKCDFTQGKKHNF